MPIAEGKQKMADCVFRIGKVWFTYGIASGSFFYASLAVLSSNLKKTSAMEYYFNEQHKQVNAQYVYIFLAIER